MSLIVRTVTKLLAAFVAAFGCYIVLYGHITPGGGFAGGTILACCFVLLVISLGSGEALKIFSRRAATVWDCLGALAFLAIASAGMWAGHFFYNLLDKGQTFKLVSSGTILWSNVAIGVKVGAALFAAFVAVAVFRCAHVPEGGREEDAAGGGEAREQR